jgi:MoxR-like ATPase
VFAAEQTADSGPLAAYSQEKQDMFDDIGQVTRALGEQQYISTDEISTVVFLAEKLGKPLMTEGPAGVGKTELAKAWAKASGKRLIRLQCYEGLDESKALYEWEYASKCCTAALARQIERHSCRAGNLTE